jgi:hypothetical protein
MPEWSQALPPWALGDRLDGQRHDDLVGDLGGLAVAIAAHQGDVLAHQLEQRFDLVEGAFRSADHDGQAGGLGADIAARHRRVQVVAAQVVDAGGELLGFQRRDRTHVDDDLARLQSFGNAAGAEQGRFDMGSVGDHGDDHLGLFRHLAAGAALPGALVEQVLRRGAQVVDIQLVPGLDQMTGHGSAHDAETDETNLHDASPCA